MVSSFFQGVFSGLSSTVFNKLFYLSKIIYARDQNQGSVEYKEKRELHLHLLDSLTAYIKIMWLRLISLFNVKYRLQRKRNCTCSITSALSLSKKLNLLLNARNCCHITVSYMLSNFGDNHVLWSEDDYYCSWNVSSNESKKVIFVYYFNL